MANKFYSGFVFNDAERDKIIRERTVKFHQLVDAGFLPPDENDLDYYNGVGPRAKWFQLLDNGYTEDQIISILTPIDKEFRYICMCLLTCTANSAFKRLLHKEPVRKISAEQAQAYINGLRAGDVRTQLIVKDLLNHVSEEDAIERADNVKAGCADPDYVIDWENFGNLDEWWDGIRYNYFPGVCDALIDAADLDIMISFYDDWIDDWLSPWFHHELSLEQYNGDWDDFFDVKIDKVFPLQVKNDELEELRDWFWDGLTDRMMHRWETILETSEVYDDDDDGDY